MELIEKHCNGCSTTKPVSEFGKDSHRPDGYTTRCKTCRNKQGIIWRQENPEKVKQINFNNKDRRKEFYDSPEGKRSSRTSWLKKTYGLTIEEYEQRLEEQNYKCAICNREGTKDRWRCLAVDHCHSTGKIRQLLCWKCNSGLGLFDDNKELLMKAINYLQQHESPITS